MCDKFDQKNVGKNQTSELQARTNFYFSTLVYCKKEIFLKKKGLKASSSNCFTYLLI